jgi:hypothetical protein
MRRRRRRRRRLLDSFHKRGIPHTVHDYELTANNSILRMAKVLCF